MIKYLCRTTESSEWLKRRFLSNIKTGLLVDFHDAFNLWRKAVVIKVFFDDDNKELVLLKMHLKGTEVFETIQVDSKRLAPSQFFTKGKYLEEYGPDLPESNYM